MKISSTTVLLVLFVHTSGGDITSTAASRCFEFEWRDAAHSQLISNYAPEFHAVRSGQLSTLGFNYLSISDALSSAQALAHYNFTDAASQFRQLLSYQWTNGFMPHIIYDQSINRSVAWISNNQTFLPGPGFWNIPTALSKSTPFPTSGIAAAPIHAEVAYRIFRLAPIHMVLGRASYTPVALKFLCTSFPILLQWHRYLVHFRAMNVTSEGLLLRSHHPWETLSSMFMSWNSWMEINRQEASRDFDQVIAALNISTLAVKNWSRRRQVLRNVSNDAMNETEQFYIHLYLIHCFAENQYDESKIHANCPANQINVEFNSMFLKSNRALVEMADILQNHQDSCPAIASSSDSDSSNFLSEIKEQLIQWNERLRYAMNSPFEQSGLWNAEKKVYMDRMVKHDLNTTSEITLSNVLPLYGMEESTTSMETTAPSTLDLIEHFISSGEGIRFTSCDRYPISIFPCAASESQAQDQPPRVVLPALNYFMHRGMIDNHFYGLAQYIANETRRMICDESHGQVFFSMAYDSISSDPKTALEGGYTSSATAAALLNMLLPAYPSPPSPDTPPIDRNLTLIVMCIELVVALALASSCLIFSIYFIATRPPEGANVRTFESIGGHEEDYIHHDEASERVQALTEALIPLEEEQEYGSFSLLSRSRSASQNDSSIGRPWERIMSFISSLGPWQQEQDRHDLREELD